MKAYIAEIIGTATLCLAVGLTLAVPGPVPTPVAAALALGIAVYTIGAVSGAHLNPAITIGLLSIGKIKMPQALLYIGSQVVGAIIAMLLINLLVTPADVAVVNTVGVGMAEIIGTFLLGFGVASVVYGKVSKSANGIVIGGSLLLGVTIASKVSNGVLNPAVALSIGSFSLPYLLSPIIGAVLAMRLYRYLDTPDPVEIA